MPRGSRFTAILTWFREASPDEVRAIMPLVLEACGKRKILISGPAVQRRQRERVPSLAERRRLNGDDMCAQGDHCFIHGKCTVCGQQETQTKGATA